MLFINLRVLLPSGDETTVHTQLTALDIPRDDPDTGQALTVEQRLKLLEMELAAEVRAESEAASV